MAEGLRRGFLTHTKLLSVVHVAADIKPVSGGVPEVVRQLSAQLDKYGVNVQVAYIGAGSEGLPDGVESIAFRPTGMLSSWYWGKGLKTGMSNLANGRNGRQPVFHIHGVWAAPQYFAAKCAHAVGTPFIVSIHGMLDPWLMNEQGISVQFKKKFYWKVFGNPALSKAMVIHAITPMERGHLSAVFPKNRIEVIPNAVEVENISGSDNVEREKKILFLGRIEPKKGVDILLKAFGQARIPSDWSLHIVGPVWSDSYMNNLRSILDEFRMGNRVVFHGPLFGAKKDKMMERSWVMAVPSHSDVIGLVNLEAAAKNLPTITTYQTGLHDWEEGGGVLIDPDVDSLKTAIEKACFWGAKEQRDRGIASRRLVEHRYSWKVVLPMWMELYDSLLRGV